MRRYTVAIEVECWDQDDVKHFQPDTVNARIVDTDITVVSGGDQAAIQTMFRFLLTGVFRDAVNTAAIPIAVTPKEEASE